MFKQKAKNNVQHVKRRAACHAGYAIMLLCKLAGAALMALAALSSGKHLSYKRAMVVHTPPAVVPTSSIGDRIVGRTSAP